MVLMTDLLSRPILRVPQPAAEPDRPVALVAGLGAAAVSVGSLLFCLATGAAGWIVADTGTFGQAMSMGTLGWLLGNGTGLTGGGVSVGMVPLGFVLACGYALFRVGRWAAVSSRTRSGYDVWLAAVVMCLAYAVPGLLATTLVGVGGTHAELPRAALAFLVLPALFGGLGLLSGSGWLRLLLDRLPEEVRAAAYGGLAGLLVMLVAGAALLAGSLVMHFDTAVTLAEGLHAGFVGGLIFTVLGLALVPNGVLCAGAFAAGPGFTVGSGTQVAPSGVRLGLLPDFPLLGALPTSASAWWLPGLIVLPVLAGAVAGVVAIRRYPVFGVDRAALRGAIAGLLGGVVYGLSTALATGSAGAGRLSQLGPDVIGTLAVCAVAFTLGGAFAAVAGRWLGGGWRHRRTVTDPIDEETTQPIPVAPRP
jgi:hypothetical protein